MCKIFLLQPKTCQNRTKWYGQLSMPNEKTTFFRKVILKINLATNWKMIQDAHIYIHQKTNQTILQPVFLINY